MSNIGSKAVRQARDELYAAQDRLMNVMREEYPCNSMVKVVHPRGEFFGTVEMWAPHCSCIWVCNLNSGKSRKWHFDQVQIVSSPDSCDKGSGADADQAG